VCQGHTILPIATLAQNLFLDLHVVRSFGFSSSHNFEFALFDLKVRDWASAG